MYKIIFTKQILALTALISFLYYSFSSYLTNFTLVHQIWLQDYSILLKIKIILFILIGSWETQSIVYENSIKAIIAILSGFNSALIIYFLQQLKRSRKSLLLGSTSLFAIGFSGCAACGIPILSLLGLGSSIIYLPFQGQGLAYAALILLLISLVILLRTLKKECHILPFSKKNTPR